MPAVVDPGERDLWVRLRRDNDAQARQILFSHHVSWARMVAISVHRRLWVSTVERSDCIQNATVGLLEAMNRFDLERGIEFRAYAMPRVRGAVFNGLRVLMASHRDVPYPDRLEERAADLSVGRPCDTLGEFVDVVVGLGLGMLLESAYCALVDDTDGFQHAESLELSGRLLAALQELGPRHRHIVEGHYFHHLPFSEFASRWNLSKGRVSQIHKEALMKLRVLMQVGHPRKSIGL